MADIAGVVDNALDQALAAVSFDRIVVALSGGLDSRALLHSVAVWNRRQQVDTPVCAIHVHHGLSAGADQWVAHCQHECRAYEFPLIVAHVQLENTGDGVEQSARLARYQVFEEHCRPGDVLLMAHHGDDQLETLLMRLSRGSGVSGMSGIPASRWLSEDEAVRIVRPFLGLRREQLEVFANRHRLSWVEDDSNRDTLLERNWWRHVVLPHIETRFPGRSMAMLRSAQRLSEDACALEYLLRSHLDQCLVALDWPLVHPVGLSIDALLKQHPPLHGNLIRGWLKRLGLLMPSSAQMDEVQGAVIRATEKAHPALVIGGEEEGYVLRRYQGVLLACCPMVAPPPVQALSLPAQEGIEWLGKPLDGLDTLKPGVYQLTCAARLEAPSRQTIKPPHRPTKKLKHVWQEACIPPWLRPLWPLLLNNGQIQSVVGIVADESAVR